MNTLPTPTTPPPPPVARDEVPTWQELRDRLDPVEIFHEILEHRWFMSERAGRDIGTTAARNDYFAKVLPGVPDNFTITAPHPRDPESEPEPDPAPAA